MNFSSSVRMIVFVVMLMNWFCEFVYVFVFWVIIVLVRVEVVLLSLVVSCLRLMVNCLVLKWSDGGIWLGDNWMIFCIISKRLLLVVWIWLRKCVFLGGGMNLRRLVKVDGGIWVIVFVIVWFMVNFFELCLWVCFLVRILKNFLLMFLESSLRMCMVLFLSLLYVMVCFWSVLRVFICLFEWLRRWSLRRLMMMISRVVFMKVMRSFVWMLVGIWLIVWMSGWLVGSKSCYDFCFVVFFCGIWCFVMGLGF